MKKFILPIFVFAFFFVIASINPPTSFATPAPGTVKATCTNNNTQATISWNPIPNDTNIEQYILRMTNTSSPSMPACADGTTGPGSFCSFHTPNPFTFNITPNQQYTWTLAAQGNGTYGWAESTPTAGQAFTCTPTQSQPQDFNLSVDPSVPTVNKPITFKATGCPANSSAGFTWKFQDATVNIGSVQTPTDASGNASHQIASGILLENNYQVNLTCGGKTKSIKFIVSEPTNVDLVISKEEIADGVYETTEKITVKASGCPANAGVEFNYDYSNSFLSPNRSIRVPATDGTATYENRYGAGTVYMDAHCFVGPTEQGKSGVLQFKVLPPKATPTPSPTPPPPSPVCRQYNSAGGCGIVNTAIGPISTDISTFIISIFTLILSLSGGVALLLIIYAGYQFMISRGNPEGINKAREMLVSALVGFLFILFSFVIMETITGNILHLPGFKVFNQTKTQCELHPDPTTCAR
jgi:hypothetical protein